MVLLILESLGSTELFFILIMALVFFGPRKLPQLSRSLGKNLADFRRASEDFKRTWDREVSLDELVAESSTKPTLPETGSSIMDNQQFTQPVQTPTIEAIAPERVIARQPGQTQPFQTFDQTGDETDSVADYDGETVTDQPESPRKRDWL